MEQLENQWKVLVVDDTPTNISVLFDTLEREGFKVLVASSGESAIQRAKFAHPDIILLDVMMPGIDGFETCERLKADEDTAGIPVIFMTALTETLDKVRGFQLGAVDYITKPFQVEEVLVRLDSHLLIQKQKKELQELNEKLAETNRSKDKFFSILSHDLKNVFMYIPQLSRLLFESHDKLSKEEIGEVAKRLYEDSKNTQSLFENLLQWSRLETNTIKYDPEEIDLAAVVKKTVKMMTHHAERKNITISAEGTQQIFVYADNNMLSAVLRNLVSNALKFTPSDGSISIAAEANEHMAEISVSDTGVGISEEDQQRLFRIDVNHSTRGTNDEQGTGIGLILCKEFIEKHGGKISVESEVKKGTTFHFTIPLKKPELTAG